MVNSGAYKLVAREETQNIVIGVVVRESELENSQSQSGLGSAEQRSRDFEPQRLILGHACHGVVLLCTTCTMARTTRTD